MTQIRQLPMKNKPEKQDHNPPPSQPPASVALPLDGYRKIDLSSEPQFTFSHSGSNELSITKCRKDITGHLEIPAQINGQLVTSIGKFAFRDCKTLTNITIPESIKRIDSCAFFGCSGLTNINIPASVNWIEDHIFEECHILKCVTIAAFKLNRYDPQWRQIDPLAFAKSFTFIVLHYEILDMSLKITGCIPNGHIDITLPNEIIGMPVTEIGNDVFKDCTGINSIITPDSIVNFPESFGIDDLVVIRSEAINPNYPWIDDILFNKDATNLIACRKSKLGSYNIPDSVTAVGSNAFDGCDRLTSISIPDSVLTAGDYVFSNCTNLENIFISDSIKKLNLGTFYGCNKLKVIDIPASITEICEQVFTECSELQFIFVSENNQNYTDHDGVLFDKSKKELIKVPGGKSGFYTIPSYVTDIGSEAFDDCNQLTNIIIPASVRNIRTSFSSHQSLASLIIPDLRKPNSFGNIWSISNCITTIYRLSGTEVEITGVHVNTQQHNFTVPFQINGSAVTKIGYKAFSGCPKLTSITIPTSVKIIDSGAFIGCTSLIAINVEPGNLIYSDIDGVLFDKDITILIKMPETKSGSYAIPESVKIVEFEAFIHCSNITNVIIPKSVNYICYRTFYKCISLTSVNIPDSIGKIGEYAFGYCSSITHIYIPESVIAIWDTAFVGCSSLLAITVSAGNSEYASVDGLLINKARTEFIMCPPGRYQSCIIPDSVKRIGNNAFAGCTGLSGITVPPLVKEIGDFAFAGCTGLSGIAIPESVQFIGNGAFPESINVTCYFYTSNKDDFLSSCQTGYSGKRKKFLGNDQTHDARLSWGVSVRHRNNTPQPIGHLSCPDQIGGIPVTSFSMADCAAISSVTLPKHLAKIGYGSFSGCSGIKSITIPPDVTEIGHKAFSGCTSLDNIIIPDSVMKIDAEAFVGCSGLSVIIIPTSVAEIGSSAFSRCSKLSSIVIPESITEIKEGTFSGCSELWRIAIPASVTKIGNSAFSDCSALTRITIPASVAEIGNSVFSGCYGLTTITLPDSTTKIGACAFLECTGLKNIVIPESVTEICYRAFSGCTGLTSIIIPESVTEVGESAFSGNTNLITVTISDSIKKIGLNAFFGCPGMPDFLRD